MKSTRFFLFLFLFLASTFCHAQTNPSLIWGTYFGGDSVTYGEAIAKDSSGNLYITGMTYSATNIATKGAYQTNGDSVNGVAFLAKFNSSGKLLWATYYGGVYTEGDGIVADKSGNIYITGYTGSDSDIATSGAYQTSNGGQIDAFVARFSSNGSLLWGTYLGGPDLDYGYGITCDTAGNIYITGYTLSDSGIATVGAYQTSNAGGADAFIAKFNSKGNILWSTYYGGSNDDYSLSITIYKSNLYITGGTGSTSGIATTGSYQSLASSSGDAFLANFSISGALVWATYFGASNNGNTVATDIFGNIYFTGEVDTYVSSIATTGAYQTSFGGGYVDGFLVKFNSAGKLFWSTYFGGSGDDGAVGLTFDLLGNVFLVGGTSSMSGIATSGAYQTSYGGGSNFANYLAKFNTTGKLLWATYYGETDYTDNVSLTTNASNYIYITGITSGSVGMTTSGTYQTSLAGDEDAFLSKFHDHIYKNDAGVYRILSSSNGICEDSMPVEVQLLNYGSDTLRSVKIGWEINGKAQTGYTWTGILNSDSTANINLGKYYFISGAYSIVAWTSLPNGTVDSFLWNDTAHASDTVLSAPVADAGGNQSICIGSSTVIGSNSGMGVTYQWKSHPAGFVSSNDTATVSPTLTITYYLKIISPCGSDSDSAVISVKPLPIANAGRSKAICSGDSASIGAAAVSGNSYSWVSNPAGFTSTRAGASPAPTVITTYILTETVTATGCSKTDSAVITVNPLPTLKTNITDSVFCINSGTQLLSASPAGGNWTGMGMNGNYFDPFAAARYSTDSFYEVYEYTDSVTGCSNSISANLFVTDTPTVRLLVPDSGCADSAVHFSATISIASKHLWSFGDGSTDTSLNAVHKYAKAGAYTITFGVNSKGNCYDSIYRTIYIDSPCTVATGIPVSTENPSISVYPNPFTNQTTITAAVKGNSAVGLTIYDMTGRVVVEKSGERNGGERFEYIFDASQYGCGIYIVKLMIGDEVITREIVRIR